MNFYLASKFLAKQKLIVLTQFRAKVLSIRPVFCWCPKLFYKCYAKLISLLQLISKLFLKWLVTENSVKSGFSNYSRQTISVCLSARKVTFNIRSRKCDPRDAGQFGRLQNHSNFDHFGFLRRNNNRS